MSILGTILLIFLIAVVVVVFDARMSGEAPSVFGYQIYRVSSGSMEPELMIDDVILVKEVEPQEVHKGDIVTYVGTHGDINGKFITHKVTEEPEYINGEYIFQTQGVASGTIPDELWSDDQLLGVFVCKLPFVDWLYSFFLQPYGLLIFILIIVALFGFEIISLIISYKKDRYDELEAEEMRQYEEFKAKMIDVEPVDEKDE